MNHRFYCVVNPFAAGGKLGRAWPQISQQLTSALGPHDHGLTQRPGDASRLARDAATTGYRVVISVGGDGTHNEVCNGLITNDLATNPQTSLGILPFGTGGDFRRMLSLHSLSDAISTLRDGLDKPIDIGRLDFLDHNSQPLTRYFLNIASLGLGGLVDQYVNQSSKRLGGKLSFMLATLQAMFNYTYPAVTFQVDNGPEITSPIMNIAVANGQFLGGGMHIAPHASLNDGLFDVIVIQKAPLHQVIPKSLDIYKGQHLTHPWVMSMRGRKVFAKSSGVVLLDVDGEAPGRLPATFQLLPSVLNLRQR